MVAVDDTFMAMTLWEMLLQFLFDIKFTCLIWYDLTTVLTFIITSDHTIVCLKLFCYIHMLLATEYISCSIIGWLVTMLSSVFSVTVYKGLKHLK